MEDKSWSRVLTPRDLGRFLATLRVEQGLTQDELAEALGVTRRYLYEIERGKPGLFTDRLFTLLRLLGARLIIEASGPEPLDPAVRTGLDDAGSLRPSHAARPDRAAAHAGRNRSDGPDQLPR